MQVSKWAIAHFEWATNLLWSSFSTASFTKADFSWLNQVGFVPSPVPSAKWANLWLTLKTLSDALHCKPEVTTKKNPGSVE
jgi:hypothetical protein